MKFIKERKENFEGLNAKENTLKLRFLVTGCI